MGEKKDYRDFMDWNPYMEMAPQNEVIVGFINGDEIPMEWSEVPVCMLGPMNGSFPAGWATPRGGSVDANLPLDEPVAWRHLRDGEEY